LCGWKKTEATIRARTSQFMQRKVREMIKKEDNIQKAGGAGVGTVLGLL
jgi:hypothetical protein